MVVVVVVVVVVMVVLLLVLLPLLLLRCWCWCCAGAGTRAVARAGGCNKMHDAKRCFAATEHMPFGDKERAHSSGRRRR